MRNDCFVTGQKNAIPHTLSGALALHLSQESYAHFIIRSSKHTIAQQIKTEMQQVGAKVGAIKTKHLQCPAKDLNNLDNLSDDEYLDIMVELLVLADRMQVLNTQSAECGVIILRNMRDEFKRTGKLTS